MNIKIISNNQSGGVTGQNITVGSNVQSARVSAQPSKLPRSWRKLIALLVGVIGLFASTLGILDYFGINL